MHEGYTLEQVVVMSRHNIRSPLSGKGSVLDTVTPHDWFDWSSDPSELSLRGGAAETIMGQYFRKWLEAEGLFPENYHPEEGAVRYFGQTPLSKPIKLYLNGKSYDAKLQNNRIDSKFGNRADIVQVRYSRNSGIATALRGTFQRSYLYMQKIKQMQEKGSKSRIILPEEYKEYISVYTTEYDDSYLIETIAAEDVIVLRDAVQGKAERMVEAEIDYENVDEGAGIQQNLLLVKLRKLNRKIGENLKLLYGYRCQLCGQLIGEEFGSHIAEAHHIDYFVKSLNNDASNQIIVCPNHHSIIHDRDPVFDRRRKLYRYENGKEQQLVLNRHL